MFTASSTVGVTPLALARILFFICFGQLISATVNTVEEKKTDEIQVRQAVPTVPGYNAHPGGKYWSFKGNNSQCTYLGELNGTPESLEDCVNICNSDGNCNAFITVTKKDKRDCGYFQCPIPVPDPVEFYSKELIAYSKKHNIMYTKWKSHTNGTTWTNDQCPEIGGTFPVTSLNECQWKCINTVDCTAIHYRVVSGCNLCELLQCPYPIPVPGEVRPGDTPHSIIEEDCEFQDDFKDACAVLECNRRTGNYIFKGYDRKCPRCRTYLDPHIVTYDQSRHRHYSYSYQGCGNYSLSQVGNTYNPTFAVYADFETCGGKPYLTCVKTVTFKNDEHTVINLRYDVDENQVEIQVNGEDIVLSSTPRIVQATDTTYPVVAWKPHGEKYPSVNLQGSSGILVQFRGSRWANSVYVYAYPNVTSDLEGLCGAVTGDVNDDFVSREGVVYSPWQRYPPMEFPLSWLTNAASNGSCDDGQSNPKRQSQPQNRCEKNTTVEEDLRTQCKVSVASGLPNAEAGLVEALVDDCVYDLCNVTDPVQWMQAIEENIQVENDTMSRTIDPSTGPPTEGYKYYTGKLWDRSVCPWLDTLYNVSLEFCFAECTKNASCNAFYFKYYNDTSSIVKCRLIHCPIPVPEPTQIFKDGTSGYAAITGPAPAPTEDLFLGPMKKIWTDTACTHLENHWYISLSECKALCLNTTTCTAINYEEDRLCVLRGCSPVPKPTWNYPSFQGYAIATAMYLGPFAKIFSDCQCAPIRNYHDKTLSECETLCANDEDCTAINFSDDDCVLRACPNPVPPPNLFYPPFQGYAIEAETKQCVQSRKCSRNNGSCISKINWDSCDGRLNKRWCNGNQCACCVPLIE